MNGRARRIGWLTAFLAVAPVVAAPARAQFEEPDTIPKFAVGPLFELNFRGARGTPPTGGDLSFGNGPSFGARVEFRASRTASLAVAGSFGRANEKVEAGGTSDAFFNQGGFSIVQVAGELFLRAKPSVPGYFVLGGGARFVNPDTDDPNDPSDDTFTGEESFTEPLGIIGLGLELAPRRRSVFRVDIRFYIAAPAEQTFETNSLVLDFILGFGYLYRL